MHKHRNVTGLVGLFFLFCGTFGAPVLRAATLPDVQFCESSKTCAGKNPRVKNVRIVQQNGARPRWAPDGQLIVFDRKNSDGFHDVYLMDAQGSLLRTLTENKAGIAQRHNGNAVFHPSGKWVVFISEEAQHPMKGMSWMGEPGIGLYANLWATDLQGETFIQLTDKGQVVGESSSSRGFARQRRGPVIATVNPLFSDDGKTLVWTERYGKSEHGGWGLWRLRAADFTIENGRPVLGRARILYTPKGGTYVTAMGFLGNNRLLVAGDMDGQGEYGMDIYGLDLGTEALVNLSKTPDAWEEGSTVTPGGQVVFMSNRDSRYPLKRDDPNWHKQPTERDYYLTDANGITTERLTYFNDPNAPEHIGKRIHAVALRASPDGKTLASTLVVDYGRGKKTNLTLKIALISLDPPL